MKIVVLQDRLRGGGTERQAVFLARAFTSAGHPASLVTFRPGGVLAAALAGTGVEPVVLQPFDTGLDWFAPGLVRTVRRLGPAVVVCMGRMANCYAGRLQAALPAAAVFATLRTGKPLPGPFRRALRSVRHLVANSEFARRAHAVPAGTADRCSVIPNALLFPELATLDPAPAEPPTILSVGQFRPGKGQFDLLAACATLPRDLAWRLEFVGAGPQLHLCQRAAARAGIADRVHFHGWQADPVGFYRRARLAALASRPGHESLPNFLVEAQCAGLPVVTARVDGAAECLQDGLTGLVVPGGDGPALAAALATLLRDRDRCASMSLAARAFARPRFDPALIVGAYLALFQRLAGSSAEG